MSPDDPTQTTGKPDRSAPRTEAGRLHIERLVTINSFNRDSMNEVVRAIEEQAATEARRELLAAVIPLPRNSLIGKHTHVVGCSLCCADSGAEERLRAAAQSLVDALPYEPGSMLGGKIALVIAALDDRTPDQIADDDDAMAAGNFV